MMTTKNPAPKSNSGWHRLLHPWFVIPVMIVVLLIAAPFMYRSYKLSLISDPGEPFDVAAFISEHTVPDSDNALAPFRNAHALLTTPTGDIDTSIGTDLWDGVAIDEKMQSAIDYVKDNEAAQIAWEKASHMPDFSEVRPTAIDYNSLLETTQNTREFARMCVIRAWIASENGNDAEAAKWLLCNLRTSRLVELHGCIINRLVGIALHNMSSETIVKWLDRQQLSQSELEQFLNEVQAIQQMTPPISDHIKMEYLMVLHSEEILQGEVFPSSTPGAAKAVLPWAFYFQGEPELLFRVYGHCVSNNLRYVDLPKYKRPSRSSHGSNICYLFEKPITESTHPSNLSPEKIELAAESSVLFQLAYYQTGSFLEAVDLENMRIRLLETAIQLEIYRKANGEFPDTLSQVFTSTDQLPIDDLDAKGAILNYVKEGPLHYRLWSVGADGIDSGGVNLTLDRDAVDLGIEMIRKP
ncbi:hypothetical protein [Rubinisphaera sp.]|uniref:hypothetical protein n=1 Tax=Rubinisphaera sp. TaxID=2024857 RepID=UPI000C0E7122|nr:hypothetical protein [Rubinisphaera sp.]MBV11964.1 hypothetical protein [Rubinisphaera sp.]HCS55231.1 hypothetical protein [Planctomycetaceae bacterium]|tara:strand:+ start:5427 stop:6830 length:1404 start_codon:yes stop_codon:yes gene_type:complete